MAIATDFMPSFLIQDFELQCGITLPEAKLVYQTYGDLNTTQSNVVLYPTSYGAQHTDVDWLIRPGGILDPTKWFIIMPNMFGNGLSTSPSTCEAAKASNVYFTHYDNIRAQCELLPYAAQPEPPITIAFFCTVYELPSREIRLGMEKNLTACQSAAFTHLRKFMQAGQRLKLTTEQHPIWSGGMSL